MLRLSVVLQAFFLELVISTVLGCECEKTPPASGFSLGFSLGFSVAIVRAPSTLAHHPRI
jgi:hypothetical protein